MKVSAILSACVGLALTGPAVAAPTEVDVMGCRVVDPSVGHDLVYVGYRKQSADPLSTSRVVLLSIRGNDINKRAESASIRFLMAPPTAAGKIYTATITDSFKLITGVAAGKFDRMQIDEDGKPFLCDPIANGSSDYQRFLVLADSK